MDEIDLIMEIRSEDGQLLVTSERVRFQQGKPVSVALKEPVTLKPGVYRIGPASEPENRS